MQLKTKAQLLALFSLANLALGGFEISGVIKREPTPVLVFGFTVTLAGFATSAYLYQRHRVSLSASSPPSP
jgi:hypothetical protein